MLNPLVCMSCGKVEKFNIDETFDESWWLIDSGSNISLTNDKSHLSDFRKKSSSFSTPSGSGQATGIGSLCLRLADGADLCFDDVHHVPSAQYSILSVSRLLALGCNLDFRDLIFTLPCGKEVAMHLHNGLYFVAPNGIFVGSADASTPEGVPEGVRPAHLFLFQRIHLPFAQSHANV